MKSTFAILIYSFSLIAMGQYNPLEPFHSSHVLFQPTPYPTTASFQKSAPQQLDSTVVSQYDQWSNAWTTATHTHYQYYPNGTIQQYTSETTNATREIVKFNPSGRIMEQLFLQYQHGQLDSLQKTTFQYNSLNQQTSDSTFIWNNTFAYWEPYAYSDNTFDLQGHLLKRTQYLKLSWAFEPITQFVFQTDALGNIIHMEGSEYVNNTWEPRQSHSHVYNTNNQRISYQYDTWDGFAYVPAYKEDFTYSHHNLSQMDRHFWHNGTWELSSYVTYQYNLLEPNNNIYLPTHFMHNKHKLVGQQTHSNTGMGMLITDSTRFHYSNHGLSTHVALTQETPYDIVQNPIHDALRFTSDNPTETQCQIYNLNGQLMDHKILRNNTESIPVSGLASGIYVVYLSGEQGMETIRVMKY